MSVNFLEVRKQVNEMGENAPARQKKLNELRDKAANLLSANANEIDALRMKVSRIVETIDPNLRCALPIRDALDKSFPLPDLPVRAVILAADGSQISPDRHAEVDYCLVNVGAIQMSIGETQPPRTTTESELLYDDALFTASGSMTEARLALMRDLRERKLLEKLAAVESKLIDPSVPIITFTDGPMELWGSIEAENSAAFHQSLEQYQEVLSKLCEMGTITAGYVDKPSANLVLRLLEISMLNEQQLANVRREFPLRGVTDIDLYRKLIQPGERSAVFALQSTSARQYGGTLSLHFFYLNVGRNNHPSLARVEVPAWVADNEILLDALHAVLVQQCQAMGTRPYPYALHRAHETAMVSMKEKEQVTAMITLELRNRGVEVGEISSKQANKDSGGSMSYQRGGRR